MSITLQISDINVYIYRTTRVYNLYDKYIKDDFLRRVADRFRRYLVERIVSQEYDYPGLSDKYSDWKSLWGLPDDFWIQYGTLKKSFLITKTDKGFSVKLSDSLPGQHKSIFEIPGRSTRAKAQPVPISEYGYYMEFGRGRSGRFGPQPPRPLIRPAFLEFKNDVYPGMLKREKKKIDKLWTD